MARADRQRPVRDAGSSSGRPDETGGEGAPGPSSERRWRERGLDRLVHRVLLTVDPDEGGLVVRVRSAAAASARSSTSPTAGALADEVALRVEVVPSPDWDCTWPRVGVRFDLPTALDRAAWFGTGPHESYPDTERAARVGRFAAGLDELNVRYSRPQETGHRAAVRALELADDTGARLRLTTVPGPGGHRPGFTLTPHTPQEVDRARTRTSCRPRPTRTCSSTTRCTASARAPAASTSSRSTPCGPEPTASTSSSPTRPPDLNSACAAAPAQSSSLSP